jgi:transposase
MIDEFRTALKSKSASYLKEFICQCDNVPFPIYNDFAKGLQVDFTAVQNAFLMPISNGVVEGNVNRLKAIKRQMYGRAGYDLLAKKVMYYCTKFLFRC